LLTHGNLFLYRGAILAKLSGTKMIDPWNPRARNFDEYGDIDFQPTPPVTRIKPWEKGYINRLKDFRGLVKRRAEPSLSSDVVHLAQWCHEHDIRVVLLNTPVHPLFMRLLPNGQADYRLFVQRLRSLTSEAGIPFLDPAGGVPGNPDYFRDTHHPNDAGGEWLTRELARFLLVNKLPN